MKEADAQAALLTPIVLGKDEMNLAEYPLSILTHRVPRDRKTYSFTQRITDHQGTVIKQTWSVLGSDKYGLPTPYDDDVLIALLYCYKEQKPQGRKIHFSLYKLCQIMQKALSKREYDRMRDSLNRLTSTTIVATNCFYDNLAKSWVSEAFHVFDRYKLYQERKGRAASPHLSFVEMSAFFHQSVAMANYIKDLNLGIYYGLALPISKRLFRYLDKNRYKKSRYEETLMRMAYKLPLTYAYPSQVKQKLAPAHEELLRHGYLTNVTYDMTREGEEKVIYEFADGETRADGSSMVEDGAAGQLVLDFYTQLTGTRDLAYDPAPKEVVLAQEYLTTYGPERSAFVVRHALEAAKAVDFPIQTFGGTKNFVPQALAAWDKHTKSEEATREAESRASEQLRREQEEQERRQQLADMRASLSDEALAVLKHRAEEALAADGVARTRLGYNMLVKLKMDELLEREYLSAPTRDDRHAPGTVMAATGTCEGAGLTRPAGASGGPVIAEPIANTFGGTPDGPIPEIEARIHARWTTGEARTREESAEFGQLLTALEAEQPPGDFSTHVLEVLHIPARDAQRFMQQSPRGPGDGQPSGARGVTGVTSGAVAHVNCRGNIRPSALGNAMAYRDHTARQRTLATAPISARRDLMAIQYKVVELKGRRDPGSGAGETPEVTAEDIETALNQQGLDNWDLFTVLERFTETSHTEESAYAGIGSSSQQYSSRIAVTLIFKKVMA